MYLLYVKVTEAHNFSCRFPSQSTIVEAMSKLNPFHSGAKVTILFGEVEGGGEGDNQDNQGWERGTIDYQSLILITYIGLFCRIRLKNFTY